MEQNISEKSVFFFFLALFCISIFLFSKLIGPFFATIILGVVTSGIFKPAFRFFSQKIRPGIAAVLTCVMIFFTIFIPTLFFVGILSKEALDLYSMAKDAVLSNYLLNLLENTTLLEKINQWLLRAGVEKTISWNEFIAPLTQLGKIIGFSLFQQAKFITSNIVNMIFYFCLMLIINYYMFIDGERFIQYIYDLSPLRNEHDKKIFNKFNEMASAILIGNGLGGLIQGIAGGMLFWLLNLNSPFLWGVIMGFLAFLPIVGIGIVLIPTAIFIMLKSSLLLGSIVIIFYALLSWSIEYIFKPKVMGDRVAIHPVIIFFSIVGGIKVYGLLGIIYGPLIATLFLTLADIYFASFQSMVEPSKRPPL